MNKLFEFKWATIKERLLNEKAVPVAANRQTVTWLEENTRINPMSNEITGTANGIQYTISSNVADELQLQGIDVESEIISAIKENVSMTATLYSKPNCPYCVRAKHLLEQKGISYEEISAVDFRDQLIKRVTEATGQAPRTVPQIWLGETYIGGFTELDAHFKNQA